MLYDKTPIDSSKLKIAIIGAGPSGLSVLHAFDKLGDQRPQLDCFDKQTHWGGMWNYSWQTGVDPNGEPVHNGMYKGLWTNTPKETLEFPTYTFEEHFGKNIPSYVPRAVIEDYMKGRATKQGVKKYITFNTSCKSVRFDKATQKFDVMAYNHKDQTEITGTYDYVFCCTGHYSYPKLCEYPGFNTFSGRIMHAHDFRDPQDITDKTVLIMGSNLSAEDIAIQCYKYKAKKVIISYHGKPIKWPLPGNMEQVPEISHAEGNKVYFVDGQEREADMIMQCTGYIHNFPFMEPSLKLKSPNKQWVFGLYHSIFFQENPKLIYIGMNRQLISMVMFDAQAHYARDVILGKIELPDYEGRNAINKKRWADEAAFKTFRQFCETQGEYIASMISKTDYPSVDMHERIEMLLQGFADREVDGGLVTFRDQQFVSQFTGKLAPKLKREWLHSFEDTLKFLDDYDDVMEEE